MNIFEQALISVVVMILRYLKTAEGIAWVEQFLAVAEADLVNMETPPPPPSTGSTWPPQSTDKSKPVTPQNIPRSIRAKQSGMTNAQE